VNVTLTLIVNVQTDVDFVTVCEGSSHKNDRKV